MAEKDAQYYYAQAQSARQNGNERLAQIMENYARQIDPSAGQQPSNGGWSPQRNANAPTRDEYEAQQRQARLQEQYNAMANANPQYYGGSVYQQAPAQPYETVVNGGGRDDADYRDGGYITADNTPVAQNGNYGVRYVDNQGNATDYVIAKQKPYAGNKLQQAAQAYYGGGVELATPSFMQNNTPVSREELDSIGLYDPDASVGQGQRGTSWKQRRYPRLHGVVNEGEGYDY